MPFVNVKVPEGVLRQEQKNELVRRITDVVVEVEGVEAVRPYVVVLVDEVADGGWGQGGRALTLDQLKAAAGGTAR